MNPRIGRIGLAVAAVAGLVAALATPASAEVTLVTLEFEHSSPFVDGEAPIYSVSVNDTAFEGGGELQVRDGDRWITIDDLEIADGIGYSLITLGPVDPPGDTAEVRALVDSIASAPVTIEVVPLELEATAPTSVGPGESAELSIVSNATWVDATADVYRQVGNGDWALFKEDVELSDGDASVVFAPARAATYYVEIDDELDERAVAGSDDLPINVWRAQVAFSPNKEPWGFRAGSTVWLSFDKGGFGTTLKVALQYEYRDENYNDTWRTLATHTTVDGHTAFSWKPTRTHQYRFKITTPNGWTTYTYGPLISRLFTTTLSAPSMVWQGDTARITATTAGATGRGGYYWVRYTDAGRSWDTRTVGYFDAVNAKATFTVQPRKGRTFEVMYFEDDLPGETGGSWLFPVEKTFTIRTLKLAAPLNDGYTSGQRLDVTLSPSATGTATLYQRKLDGHPWEKVKSFTVSGGKASVVVHPSTVRFYQVRYGSGESNAVRVTP